MAMIYIWYIIEFCDSYVDHWLSPEYAFPHIFSNSFSSSTVSKRWCFAVDTRKGMLHESRIAEVTAGHISFHYKDHSDAQQHKQMQLSCDEFIRRYLLYVLPKGLMWVRHLGFIANACRHKKLALILWSRKTVSGHARMPVRSFAVYCSNLLAYGFMSV